MTQADHQKAGQNQTKKRQLLQYQGIVGVFSLYKVRDRRHEKGSYRNPEGLKYNHLLKYLLHLPISLLIVFIIIPDSVKIIPDKFVLYKTSNPQLSSSASFLRLNVLSSLN